jgi:trehalose 6-phosphate phosphatase
MQVRSIGPLSLVLVAGLAVLTFAGYFVLPGKQVVNVLPAHAPNKGDALLELRKADRADTALYIGDDTTDEDVFKLDQPGRLVTVRVAESLASAATYCLRSQRDIDRLLAKLISHREKGAIA